MSLKDMDLCCLIDSEEQINATSLVNMLGDLLGRGTFAIPLSPISVIITYPNNPRVRSACASRPLRFHRDKVPCKAAPARPHTHSEAHARSLSGPSAWNCL